MNTVEYITKKLSGKHLLDSEYIVISSLVYTLSPDEACDFLDLSFQQDARLRRYILKKISLDMTKNYSPRHKVLIKNLLELIDIKGFLRKESCSASIDTLIPNLPTKEKNRILDRFLDSKSKRNRNRAYNAIRNKWTKRYKSKLETNWDQYKDPYCLAIILGHFPAEYLLQNYKTLMNYCTPFQQSRMFLRLSEKKYELLEDLKNVDQISYAYVLTKNNVSLSEKEAREFLKNNYKDERIGLLLWCFGQMGLSQVIVEYDSDYREKHLQALFDRYI